MMALLDDNVCAHIAHTDTQQMPCSSAWRQTFFSSEARNSIRQCTICHIYSYRSMYLQQSVSNKVQYFGARLPRVLNIRKQPKKIEKMLSSSNMRKNTQMYLILAKCTW